MIIFLSGLSLFLYLLGYSLTRQLIIRLSITGEASSAISDEHRQYYRILSEKAHFLSLIWPFTAIFIRIKTL